ncbi:MAG: uroporphyrinogen decarboxylase family protein [Actinobacteria bacterium]|nr:uroporphyrinogen decarboxylase family protein [Actinomycetota bacterium]
MAKYKINIKYSSEVMKKNKVRLESAKNFLRSDRVPVLFGIFERYILKERGVGYLEFFSDSRAMLHHEILNQKWAIENIPDDRCQENIIWVYPWWENVVNANSLGAEVVWFDDQPPYVKPLFGSVEEVTDFRVSPSDSGLWGERKKYFFEWRELVKDYEVYFNGEPGKVEIQPLDIGGESSFCTAVNLAGQSFYAWLSLYPNECRDFLSKITNALVNAGLFFREIDPGPRSSFIISEDFAEIISPDMFRRFCVPYDNRLFDALGKDLKDGRSMHMCGDTTHLLDILVNEEKITSFIGFGSSVNPYIVAEKMGGKVYLWGNLSCTSLLNGPEKIIYEEALNCIRAFSRFGGFCLGDGFNVAPGTPLENLETAVLAAKEFGSVPEEL